MRGLICKGIAGFYYCLGEDGKVYETRARGIFRNVGTVPLAGDEVEFSDGMVTRVLPRRNAFERPPLANAEILIITAAAKDPDPSFPLIDRLCCTAEKQHAEVLLCVSKADLADEALRERFRRAYHGVYPLFFCSAVTGEGLSELREAIRGRKAAFSGPSGAGKSTLTNLLLLRQVSETGDISQKTLRGKNTTRHTELFIVGDLMLFDTPGFTAFEDDGLQPEEVETLFPEFAPVLGRCLYSNCVHLKEDGCAVTDAVRRGDISRSRYRSYREIYRAAKKSNEY